MNQNESIQDMQKRFTHIINHLASLGKVFPNKDLINKVLTLLEFLLLHATFLANFS
nr:hypothetical protein KK1_042641 [Cajanus cajan]KYP36256.1 hypothetical protein KK1_042648 [Cajanus cajan]